jgi:IclR family transcriptional regulator, pca regulon regulatory protein
LSGLGHHTEPSCATLAEEFNESCSAAVLDDKEIVYVAGMPAKRSLSLTLTIGSRLPAYPTSMGRVLLAALLRQIRRVPGDHHAGKAREA